MAMGAADIVPGVSGGTVAFITGIYEELLRSIAGLAPSKLRILREKGVRVFWEDINGAFLLTLFSGILFSIFSLAKLISHLLQVWPHLVWSLFFGLIIASIYSVGKGVRCWNLSTVASCMLGALSAFAITLAAPTSVEMTPLAVFLAGTIAISAMILPGISGSFILVLLGMYQNILEAVKSLNILTLATFAGGCVCGLVVMSRVLSWAFKKYHDLTLAILMGFMIGAMNKVWPWKQTISWRTSSHGELQPLEQISILPETYEKITGLPSDLLASIILMLAGLLIVTAVEYLGRSKQKKM
jgi:putative membrane protein